jgi:hypothetical protein
MKNTKRQPKWLGWGLFLIALSIVTAVKLFGQTIHLPRDGKSVEVFWDKFYGDTVKAKVYKFDALGSNAYDVTVGNNSYILPESAWQDSSQVYATYVYKGVESSKSNIVTVIFPHPLPPTPSDSIQAVAEYDAGYIWAWWKPVGIGMYPKSGPPKAIHFNNYDEGRRRETGMEIEIPRGPYLGGKYVVTVSIIGGGLQSYARMRIGDQVKQTGTLSDGLNLYLLTFDNVPISKQKLGVYIYGADADLLSIKYERQGVALPLLAPANMGARKVNP